MSNKVLLIGGHGKVAQLATPRLVAAGFDVTSMIRNPEQVPDIEALGSTPLVRDLTALNPGEWAEILEEFAVVVWSAGNGGRAGKAATYAIDRDGALACIEALELLRAKGIAPRFLMVSYLGSIDHGIDPEDGFYPYADAKETVDKQLLGSELNYLILAPSRLTMEPAGGVAVVDNRRELGETTTTARELVAEVIVAAARVDQLPEEKILPFVDAESGVDAKSGTVAQLFA